MTLFTGIKSLVFGKYLVLNRILSDYFGCGNALRQNAESKGFWLGAMGYEHN